MRRCTPTIRALMLVAVSMLVGASAAIAAPATLPAAVALPEEIAKAVKTGQPLVVMVSLEGCGFCKIVRENHLAPMREREGLAVVQVDMRSKQMLIDLRGNRVTHDALVRSWGVKVAPTILFLGRDGAEVADRLVGGYIADFYGAYLDERLQVARVAVNKGL